MIEELPHRAHHYKATVVVRGGRIGAHSNCLPCRGIEAVFPHQFVREGEGVSLEEERARGLGWGGNHACGRD
jgi:hypothetical protein